MTTLLSPTSPGFSEQISALNNAMANPPPRARMFGRAETQHIADMTFQELDASLNFGKGCGMTPFINLFKLIHLNDDAPRNHNVLLESKHSTHGFVCQLLHWRLVENVQSMLMDCLNYTATEFLDIEELMEENMDTECFQKVLKLRDRVERGTCHAHMQPSTEIRRVLDRIRDAIVHFTACRPDLLAYAKADYQLAPPLEEGQHQGLLRWRPSDELRGIS